MKKIPTVFVRDREGSRQLFDQVTPGCEWVVAGEGVATRKFDGTACMIRDGKFWKRREVKIDGKAPPGFVEEDRDEVTGKRFGWTLVDPKDPADKYHREAFARCSEGLPDGTYELIGSRVQGGAEAGCLIVGAPGSHILVRHGETVLEDVTDRSLAALRDYLEAHEIEGIVFHHSDGRMAKVKRRDFGLPWPISKVGVKA